MVGGWFPPTARCARRPWVGATAFFFFHTRRAATEPVRGRAVGLGGGVERHGWRETRPAWMQSLPSPAQPHRPAQPRRWLFRQPRGGFTRSTFCNQGKVEQGLRSAAECCIIPLLVRGGAVWQLVGLITRRSQVQILPPLPTRHQTRAIPETESLFSFQGLQRRAQLAPTRCKVYHQRAGGISDGWLCMERDHPATGFDQKLGFAGDRVSAPCGRNPMTGFHRTKGPVGPFAFPERARRGPDLFHIQQQGRL